MNGITLITGDRVVVAGQGHRVEPGPGRQVGFSSQVRGGHLYVIPSDAAPLLAQGVLDRRLFDVTQLLAWRYGDADTPDIPVIEQGITTSLGSSQVRKLSSLGMSAARVSKANAAQTWRTLTGARALVAGRTKLWLDGRRPFLLDDSVKQIGAPQAWEQGLTGKGVTVAVLDTGYDPEHPDLKDAVMQERNFSDEPDMRDNVGHGTHVASIVAGRGEKYRGVAPEASLAIGKVGGPEGPTDSAALAGMEWAAVEVKAKIVNMSFGNSDLPELDPLEQAVNTLSERTGTLFVAGAGNGGPLPSLISPASADAALAVGAVDKQDQLANFSSPGPRLNDHAIKPELTAPGKDITAAAPGGGYQEMSGTSMSTPHVAGAAAILAQRHPDWTGARLKAALIGSAAPAQRATLYQQGAGMVDLVRGLRQQVVAEQGSLWAVFPYNGPGERSATKTITYANTGDSPVTLDLSHDSQVLKLSAEHVTVPAAGKASVTLTIDAGGKAPGDYPGTVTARSGDTVIRTLAGAYVEPESYDVTITVLDAQGRPADPRESQVYNARTGAVHLPVFRDGVATVRLPEGDWNVFTEVGLPKLASAVADVPVTIDGGDRQLTVDMRQSKPVTFTLDDPGAENQPGSGFGLSHGQWNFGMTWSGSRVTALHVVPSRQPGLTYTAETTWVNEDVSPGPVVYSLVDRRTGGIPDDPTYHARQQDLAKVTATYRASGVAATGTPHAGARIFDVPGASMIWTVRDIALPATVIHYRTPGLTYESGLKVGDSVIVDGGRQAKPGQTGEVWNAAVTGPSFLLPGGGRTGDSLLFSGVGLFADGGEGRSGSDGAATGSAALARDGHVLATADLTGCSVYESHKCRLHADLPAERGTYSLTASMRRQVPYSALSTGVESVWTFRSGTTTEERPLPLMAVRYRPEGLDDFNRARPGSTTRVPVWVERNPGSTKAEVASIRLELSADDGATWRGVPVTRTGSGWTATPANPRTAGFVSLRAVVTDTAGNRVTQTITRAYAVS
ncbi:S8 family serine peptidase [Nonomuraea angiospora]|uniref:Subtilisin family serine protease n=1 Tax=Nonomuraea angiospora TaxID=46172 RepID=A0ABR9MGC1_9ACTN|nr:S8 family serine peptidase [Nonomuraea angiospora]MBE1591567.1 subtilisin family serine protease [Nonomuraea angiospora]